MLYKRFIHSKRNYALTLSQIMILTIFTILACYTLLDQSRIIINFRLLTLDLTYFKSPITPYDVRPLTGNAQKLSTCYAAAVSRHSKPVFINSEPVNYTLDEYLINIGKSHKDQYYWKYQIGATIEEEQDGMLNITGFFNNHAYHSIAISLSYLGNSLMQCFGNKEYQIETINHPLPMNSSKQNTNSAYSGESGGLLFSFYVSIGLALLFGTFVVFLIKERKSGAKHSQLVSGVKLHNFWLATFLWDYVNYLVLCILIIVIILCFQTEGYRQYAWWVYTVLRHPSQKPRSLCLQSEYACVYVCMTYGCVHI